MNDGEQVYVSLKQDNTVILLVLLLAGLVWWWLGVSDPVIRQHNFQAQDEVDGYLSHFIVTTMNNQGQPNHRLEAEKMVLFSGTSLSQVDKPFLTLYRDNANPWLIRAEHGLVQKDTETVFLTGDVRMTHEDDLGNVTEVLTDQLEVRAKIHYAETEHAVVVNHYRGKATGIGMQAYLDEGRLSLMDQVRSRYEATRH